MLNSKKTVSICILALALSASAFADSTETRSEATANKTVLSVGDCKGETRQDANTVGVDANGNPLHKYKAMPYASLDVKYCQEYDEYQVNIGGKFWNTTESKIPNSDKLTYQSASDPQTFDSELDKSGPVNEDQKLKISDQNMESCNKSRDQLRAQLSSQGGVSHCSAN